MTEQPGSSSKGPSSDFWRTTGLVTLAGAIISVLGAAVVAIIDEQHEDAGSAGVTAIESPVASVTQATSTVPNAAQEESRRKRLLSVISDQGIRATCSQTIDGHFTGSLIVMECASSELAALRVGLFPSLAAMYTVYNRAVDEARLDRGSGSGAFCASEPAEGTWSITGKQPPDGRLFCQVDDEGRVWFEWTYDRAKVLVFASRRDDNFGALNRWWLNF